jgi:hypothetical protein
MALRFVISAHICLQNGIAFPDTVGRIGGLETGQPRTVRLAKLTPERTHEEACDSLSKLVVLTVWRDGQDERMGLFRIGLYRLAQSRMPSASVSA